MAKRKTFTPSLKPKLSLRLSAVKVPKQKCVGDITSAMNNFQSVPETHHSDQGVQYLSNAYISLLRHHGIGISVARRGCPWENGHAERLIRALKEEEVHLNDYEDIYEVKARIGHFITQVYHYSSGCQMQSITINPSTMLAL